MNVSPSSSSVQLHHRAHHHQLHLQGDLVLGADLTLVAASVLGLDVLYGEADDVRDGGLGVKRGEPRVGDEGLPVDSQDVPVPLPQPGDGLVVEVVDLALEERGPAHLAREHEVRRPVEEGDVEAEELVEVLTGGHDEEESDEDELSLDGHDCVGGGVCGVLVTLWQRED